MVLAPNSRKGKAAARKVEQPGEAPAA